MKKTYIWNSRRKSRRFHIAGIDGRSVCKVEHCGTVNDASSKQAPPNRKLCNACKNITRPHRVKNKTHGKRSYGRDYFLMSGEWKEIRYRVLRASNGKCSCCGASPLDGIVLNVDHIKSRIKYPELALTISNLQVLCSSCNHGKGWKDETDWREPRLSVVMGESVE